MHQLNIYIGISCLDLPCLKMIENTNEKTVRERKNKNSQLSVTKRIAECF